MSSYDFTVMRSAELGNAAKTATRAADGTINLRPYDNVTRWRMHPCMAASNEEMARKLRSFSARPDLMIVAGAPIPDLDLSKPQLRRSNNPDASTNTLMNVPRSSMAIDIDDIAVPAPFGNAEQLPKAAEFIRDTVLPDEFHGIECVAASTSSTGLKGAIVARLRLFFLLNCAYPLERLRAWGRAAQIAGVQIDPSVLLPSQPIYTARPVFIGMDDPVPAELRAFVLPGPFGDRVPLVVDRYDAKAADVVHKLRQVEHEMRQGRTACGLDWRALLDRTVAGPDSYHEPLKQGIGLAARSTATEEEIADFVVALLADRADPKRQSQYNRGWILKATRSFRSRDSRTDTEIANLKSQLIRRR